jgi:hypothetical protein
MTVKELKEKCKEKGLKVSGTKKQLIERLESPDSMDITTNPGSTKVTVGFKLKDPKRSKINPLLLKGFAKLVYYSCDKWYYEVDKKMWADIIKS